MNPIRQLERHGQSPWLDYIQRALIDSGGLQSMITNDGINGIASNPAIFRNAIAAGTEYANEIRALRDRDLRAVDILERISIEDIRRAAEILAPTYAASHARQRRARAVSAGRHTFIL